MASEKEGGGEGDDLDGAISRAGAESVACRVQSHRGDIASMFRESEGRVGMSC
jgi:hypothetical protein